MTDFLPHWFVPAVLALFGACIGSFLNVVIYRSPLGLSLNDPSRSFCPQCKSDIPWYLNLPVLSWLMLRGRCAHCKCRIPVRYWLVEVLTAGLFLAVGAAYDNAPVITQIGICLWIAMAVAVAFIDAATMLVFPRHTLLAAGFALLATCAWPLLINADPDSWTGGFAMSVVGAAAGFMIIRLVIELGKVLFGSWKQEYQPRSTWHLKEPENDDEEMELVLPDRSCPWSELFARPTDKAVLRDAGLVVDGRIVPASEVVLYADRIETDAGETLMIESIESARGTLSGIKANREAMGAGDAWIMMMIGALCGWEGCVFSLIAGSVLGVLAAILGRIGFSRPMPFGPALLAGSVIWLFGGKQLWVMYLDWASM